MAELGDGADALQVYLTGSAYAEQGQDDPGLSLGAYRSCVRVASLTPLRWSALQGIKIEFVAGMNGTGNGTLTVTGSSQIAWTPPLDTMGAAVTIANGETKVLYGGTDPDKYIVISRNTVTDLVGSETVQLLDTYNTWVAGRNFTDAEQDSGEAIYHGVIFHNANALSITDLKVWLDSASDTYIEIAKESPVSGAITDNRSAGETTEPAGLSWVHPTSEGTALNIGTLAATVEYGLWRKRIVTALESPDARKQIILNYSFVLDGTTHYGQFRGINAIPDEDADTYEVYIGTDTTPDFTAAPYDTFDAFPYETAALAADHDYYVATLQRNRWGVLSGIPEIEIIRVAADGSQSETPPSAPSVVEVKQSSDGGILITASYHANREGLTQTEIDALAATHWAIYIEDDGTDPDPSVDSPVVQAMSSNAGPNILAYTDDGWLEDQPLSVLVRTRRVDGLITTDSTNTTPITTTAKWFGPVQNKPVATSGRAYAYHQINSTGPTETVWIDEANNIYWQVLPSEVRLWADSVLVWNMISYSAGRIELRTHWSISNELVAGAGTDDAIEVASWTVPDKTLYVTVNGVRRIKLDVTNLTISIPYMDYESSPSTTLAEVPAWRKWADTCFQIWDMTEGRWTTAMSVDSDGKLCLGNISLTQFETQAECLT